MGAAEIIGIAWALVAAVFLGVFALPTKYTKESAWENTWGAANICWGKGIQEQEYPMMNGMNGRHAFHPAIVAVFIAVDVPCDSFRFFDIELNQPLGSGK